MYKLQSQVKATTSVRLIMLLGPFPLEAGKQNCKVLTQAIGIILAPTFWCRMKKWNFFISYM